MFWDGRVEMVDPANRKLRTPLGNELPKGLDNAMAAQALFPLITANEMLGYPGDDYAGFKNELAGLVNPDNLNGAGLAFDAIMLRLIGNKSMEASNVREAVYRDLFLKAFPDLSLGDLSIVQAANALAHFEELAFATRNSRWDSHLAGDNQALSVREKKGALLFFGKGRCVACHNGDTFSDYQFHSVGVIDEDWRIESENRDLGRFNATKAPSDAFKFRTPPLRNVTKTKPYFHNGSEYSLNAVIQQHVAPIANANRYHSSGRFLMTAQQIQAVSPVLTAGINLTDNDISLIVDFLGALETELTDSDLMIIIPKDVPSGLPIEYY
jgi:cytochrome c peroxidase